MSWIMDIYLENMGIGDQQIIANHNWNNSLAEFKINSGKLNRYFPLSLQGFERLSHVYNAPGYKYLAIITSVPYQVCSTVYFLDLDKKDLIFFWIKLL